MQLPGPESWIFYPVEGFLLLIFDVPSPITKLADHLPVGGLPLLALALPPEEPPLPLAYPFDVNIDNTPSFNHSGVFSFLDMIITFILKAVIIFCLGQAFGLSSLSRLSSINHQAGKGGPTDDKGFRDFETP